MTATQILPLTLCRKTGPTSRVRESLLVFSIVVALVPPAAAAPPLAPAEPSIVGVYPNPVADEDAGEFVVLSVPPGTDTTALRLTDGEATVSVPALRHGEIALSTAPNRTRKLIDRRVRGISGSLRLANGGERLRLVRENRTLDTVAYEDAPPGAVYWAGDTDGRGVTAWRPLGATDRPVIRGGPGTVRAFVLPDAPGVPVETVRGADRRILLAGYTFTSKRVSDALAAAMRRNVTVRVLVEGGPVGGMSQRQARRLDRLADAGANVSVVDGERARVRYHHAKYAVVDDQALVTTENWKPAGTGGHASRGWGAVTTQPDVVAGLVATFRADAGWYDAVPWERYRQNASFVAESASTGRFGTQFVPRQIPVDRTRLLVAPDNAEPAVREVLADADESIWVEQVSVGGVNQPFVRESVAAARRGVRVRILLSGAWYVREENRRIADRLNRVARRDGLDLEVKIVDPRGRFARIHAKGAVVDGDQVLLGSLNWNNNSARANREVALILEGEEVGSYYQAVVRADWNGGSWRVTVGLVAALAVLVGIVLWRGKQIRFEP